VSKDEEELQKARLQVKRGLPLQNLSGSRGFPDDGRAPPQQAPQEPPPRRQQPEPSRQQPARQKPQ
jgi:hypothetical protein